MDLYLKGKAAVVTGASQGLGKATTMQLAIEGVRVFATARNEALLKKLKEEVVASGGLEPIIFVQDLLDVDAPKNIAKAALSNLGQIDILINNAGRSRPMDVIGNEEGWAESMTVEFDRPRQLTQELLPNFIKHKQGAILNIGSMYELRFINASAVTKASIVMWSKQLAGQLGQYGITVNCLQPGLIDTENVRPLFSMEERKKFAAQEIPLGDFGVPEDVANMATFLVSPRARYITGTVAVVDGGMRRHPF